MSVQVTSSVLDRHSLLRRPLGDDIAQDLGPVVCSEDVGEAVLSFELLKDAKQASGRNRGIDFDVPHLGVDVIDDIERNQAPTAGQCIAHEVGGQD